MPPAGLGECWREAFWKAVQQHEIAGPLKQASLERRLGEWTRLLTATAVETCLAVGWRASARNHKLDLLPVPRSEYLALDVMAFAGGAQRWRFPVAVLELENSSAWDKVAYSLWKVLCVRADLRIVFCYSREGSALVRFLADEVIRAMGIAGRMETAGETLVVVGKRDEAATFPYGFFDWWELEKNTGTFRVL